MAPPQVVKVVPYTYPLESGNALVYHRKQRQSSEIDLVELRRKEFRRSVSQTFVIKPASFEVEQR